MNKISKYKIDNEILIPLIIFAIISVLSIYSAETLLPSYMNGIALKQLLWFIFGFGIAFILMSITNEYIYKYSIILYILGNISLIALLFFAEPINGSKCWFTIQNIGTIQPSEFMKIILIITLGVIINKHNEKYNKTSKKESLLILKVLVITLIPSILTFLQPDTGIVVIYFIIALVMLIVSGISNKWFLLLGSIVLALGIIFFVLYFFYSDLFIDIFGTNFFYRIDRIMDWKEGSGMQLENALAAIGSAGLFGFGINNTPIYFPEPHTDFIFSVFASNFGFIGCLFLISLMLYFDNQLIKLVKKSNSKINKYILGGIIGMIVYQQVQSIGMNLGILPITGITLPFISYGGSSLISYMLIASVIFNISNESLRYANKKRT